LTFTLDFFLYLFAGLIFLIGLFFLLRGLQFRSRSSHASYGVAQQDARRAMQTDFVRGIAAGFVGLILLGVVGLSPSPAAEDFVTTEPPPTRAIISSTNTPTSTPTSPSLVNSPIPPTEIATQELLIQGSPTFEPTSTPVEPTSTITPEPALTDTPKPLTATVNSGVGVWLRRTPGVDGEQVEWVLDGTVLTLLPGVETADEFEWQQVITPEGNEGWVAIPFILYNE